MNRIRKFEDWRKKKICVFQMVGASLELISSLDILSIPYFEIKEEDQTLESDFFQNKKEFCSIIISGGFSADGTLPEFPESVFKSNLPIFGICLGHEILGKHLGSQLIQCNPGGSGEYGEVLAELSNDLLFRGLDLSQRHPVRMAHHFMLDKEPDGTKLIASTNLTKVAGFHHPSKNMWGLQFHPEKDWLKDTVLKNFYKFSIQ